MTAPGLHAERVGSGPPVVLLHGFTGSTRSWDAVREHLAPEFTVLAIDLPGHGRSPAPADPAYYALGNAAELVARVLDRERLDRVLVVGYSMGGRTALRFALAHPSRCAGLVLESASPGITDDAERQARRAQDEALAALIEREGIPAFVKRWEGLPLWASQARLDPASIARQREIRLSQSPAGLANSLRGAGAGVDPALLDALDGLTMPVLLMAGALDLPYVAHAQAMARRIRRAQVHLEPQAGHALHLERPLKVASLLKQFARALPL